MACESQAGIPGPIWDCQIIFHPDSKITKWNKCKDCKLTKASRYHLDDAVLRLSHTIQAVLR